MQGWVTPSQYCQLILNLRWFWRIFTLSDEYTALAQCKSVQNLHANLAETLDDLSGVFNYFEMLPNPLGAKQSAPRLCKSIPRCSWKHLQLWGCIQDATKSDIYDILILWQLRPQSGSAGDFESRWDLCTALWDILSCILTAVVLRVP